MFRGWATTYGQILRGCSFQHHDSKISQNDFTGIPNIQHVSYTTNPCTIMTRNMTSALHEDQLVSASRSRVTLHEPMSRSFRLGSYHRYSNVYQGRDDDDDNGDDDVDDYKVVYTNKYAHMSIHNTISLYILIIQPR